jgi:hypothetical protein
MRHRWGGAVERGEVSAGGETVDVGHAGDDGCRADLADPDDVGQGGAVDLQAATTVSPYTASPSSSPANAATASAARHAVS